MRNDLKLLPWEICSEAAGWNDEFLESVFFLGNGRMGVRGYLPFEPDSRPTQQGLFLAGIFGEIKDGITDFVNLPSPICETLLLNGVPAVLASSIHRTLDLKAASFHADFTLTAGDTRAAVRYTRFFPKELPALLMQRFEIHVQSDVELELRSGINLSSCNSPIPDDQVKENTELVQLAPLQFVTDDGSLFSCTFETVGTGLRIEQEVRFYAPDFTQGIVQNSGAEVTCPLTAHAAAGQTLVVENWSASVQVVMQMSALRLRQVIGVSAHFGTRILPRGRIHGRIATERFPMKNCKSVCAIRCFSLWQAAPHMIRPFPSAQEV